MMLFNDSNGLYNYCPTIFQDNDKRYIYYCTNLFPYKIIDYIGFRVGELKDNKWLYGYKTYVFGPSVVNCCAWDHVHACDPSVIYGDFKCNDTIYHYCMAYLGCNTLDCTINEIGLAFSETPNGPWIKYEHNPVIPFDLNTEGRYWGVGQPSIVSIDKIGKFRLFYTRGDKKGAYTLFVDCDFSDIMKPTISLPTRIPERGLTNKKGEQDQFTNGDFAYDPIQEGYYVVRDRYVRDGLYPSIITSELQVNFASSRILHNEGCWSVITNISPTETNFCRNHNAGLVRDKYGWLLNHNELEVVYTSSIYSSSNEDLVYLWNYRLHNYSIKI